MTLGATWLKGRAVAAGRLSVSQMLDRLIADARAGASGAAASRSVVGSVRIAEDDPRVRLGRGVRAFVEDLFSNPAYQAFELDSEQVCCADESRPNDDPFDGLICAAAVTLGLPLVTRDQEIQDWGRVRTVW